MGVACSIILFVRTLSPLWKGLLWAIFYSGIDFPLYLLLVCAMLSVLLVPFTTYLSCRFRLRWRKYSAWSSKAGHDRVKDSAIVQNWWTLLWFRPCKCSNQEYRCGLWEKQKEWLACCFVSVRRWSYVIRTLRTCMKARSGGEDRKADTILWCYPHWQGGESVCWICHQISTIQ